MGVVNAIQDKNAPLALPYGKHAVKGYLAKYVINTSGSAKEVFIQHALGIASYFKTPTTRGYTPWAGCDGWYYGGEEIPSSNYTFHSGAANDAPDAYFPDDDAHPGASSIAGKLPPGMGEDENPPNRAEGIFRTTMLANYNALGQQVDQAGDPLSGSANPDNFLIESYNPALEAADAYIKRAGYNPADIDYGALVNWRNYNDVLIPWDDGSYVPKNFHATPFLTGSLPPGDYYLKVCSFKGGDVSGPSAEVKVTLSGSNARIQCAWHTVEDVDGYRVFIGTAPGGQNKFFEVTPASQVFFAITTLSTALNGAPPSGTTGTLIRWVKRFQSHLFFLPPFSLGQMLDRILQISCADFQWRNGRLRFLTPEDRPSVYTFDRKKTGRRVEDFVVRPRERKDRPNQIRLEWRDLDTKLLEQGEPIIIPDPDAPSTHPYKKLQEKDHRIKTLVINGGCMTRSQAERVAWFWARREIDMDRYFDIEGAPSSYPVLPADVVSVTNDVPNYTNVQCMILTKEEDELKRAGYKYTGVLYAPGLYSDTSHSPAVRKLPRVNPSAFAAPAQVTSVTLDDDYVTTSAGTVVLRIQVAAQFAVYRSLKQRGRVFIRKAVGETDDDYRDVGVIEPRPDNLRGATVITGVERTDYLVKVVPETPFASAGIEGATAFPITVAGKTTPPTTPAELRVTFNSTDGPNAWIELDWDKIPDLDLDVYELYEVVGGVETLKWSGKATSYRRHPRPGETTINFRLYARDTSDNLSAGFAANSGTIVPLAAPATLTLSFDPFRFVYKCATVSKAVGYQWSKTADFSSFDFTTGPQFIDTRTADIARTGTIYVRAVDKWANPGAIKPQAYNIPYLTAPSTLTIRYEPMRLVYRCTAVADARRYEWSRSGTFTDSDITTGPTFTETDLTIPRSGTIYVRAIDKWDDPGAVKSAAYNIPALPAPASLTIRYEPMRLVYRCAEVANAKKYQWSRVSNFATFDITTGPTFTETDLTIARSGTIYCRALDAWDDPGSVRSTAYNIPPLPAPATLTVNYEPMRLVYRCTAVTNAKKYQWSREPTFASPDITAGPSFIETDLTIPRSGTIYCRALDAWDDPGTVRSTAYAIPALPAPAAHTITFDGRRLTHTCTPVANAKHYQWADDAAFTVNVVTTKGPLYVEAELAGQPRTGTVYVRALDAWDDPGASKAGTYNVPQPGKPLVVPGTPVNGLTPITITPNVNTNTKAILRTAIKWGSNPAVTKNVREKILAGNVTKPSVESIAGFNKVYVLAAHEDAFGWGVYGSTGGS